MLSFPQDYLHAPLQETHLKSKDTNYNPKGRGQVAYTSETEKQTNKQMDSVWVPRDSQ